MNRIRRTQNNPNSPEEAIRKPKPKLDYDNMTPAQQAQFKKALAQNPEFKKAVAKEQLKQALAESPEFKKALAEKAKSDPKLKAAIAEGMRKQKEAATPKPTPAAAEAAAPTRAPRLSMGRNGWSLNGPVVTSPRDAVLAQARTNAARRAVAKQAEEKAKMEAAPAVQVAPRAGPKPTLRRALANVDPFVTEPVINTDDWDLDDTQQRKETAQRNREIIASESKTLTDEEQQAIFRTVHFRHEAGASTSPDEVRELVVHAEALKQWKVEIKKEFPVLSQSILHRPLRFTEPVINAMRSVKGVPGTHVIALAGRTRTFTIVNDDNGKLVDFNTDTKGPGFGKRIGQSLGTFFSIVPTPIQPFVAAGMALDSADQNIKDGENGAALINVGSAVIGLGGEFGAWGQGASNASNASNALNAADTGTKAIDAATGLERAVEIGVEVASAGAAVADLGDRLDQPSTPAASVTSTGTGTGSNPATSGQSPAPQATADAPPPAPPAASGGETPAANQDLTNSLTPNENAAQPVIPGTGDAQNAGAAIRDVKDLRDTIDEEEDKNPAGTVTSNGTPSSVPPTRNGPGVLDGPREPRPRIPRIGPVPTPSGPTLREMNNQELLSELQKLTNVQGVMAALDASPKQGIEYWRDGAKGGPVKDLLNALSIPAVVFTPVYAVVSGAANFLGSKSLSNAQAELTRRVNSGRISLDSVPRIKDQYGPIVGAMITAASVARMTPGAIRLATDKLARGGSTSTRVVGNGAPAPTAPSADTGRTTRVTVRRARGGTSTTRIGGTSTRNPLPLSGGKLETSSPYGSYAAVDTANPKLQAYATIHDGVVDMTIRSVIEGEVRSSVIRGGEQFRAILNAFPNARAIKGTWIYGTNLREFNRLTASGLDPVTAAARTWTGRQARAAGFTEITFPRPPRGDVGAYTKVGVLFERPSK